MCWAALGCVHEEQQLEELGFSFHLPCAAQSQPWCDQEHWCQGGRATPQQGVTHWLSQRWCTADGTQELLTYSTLTCGIWQRTELFDTQTRRCQPTWEPVRQERQAPSYPARVFACGLERRRRCAGIPVTARESAASPSHHSLEEGGGLGEAAQRWRLQLEHARGRHLQRRLLAGNFEGSSVIQKQPEALVKEPLW